MVAELVRQKHFQVEAIYALPDWADRHPAAPGLEIINERQLDQISQLRTPNQVVAVVEQKSAAQLIEPKVGEWLLYLDGIQSPSNLGAILRIADWFGFGQVIGGPGTADFYNAKTIQAGMGAFLRVQYHEMDLAALCAQFPELAVLGADSQGATVFDLVLPKRGILAIGSEAAGVQPDSIPLISQWVSIPKGPSGGAESLNAAVATGILCAALGRSSSEQPSKA